MCALKKISISIIAFSMLFSASKLNANPLLQAAKVVVTAVATAVTTVLAEAIVKEQLNEKKKSLGNMSISQLEVEIDLNDPEAFKKVMEMADNGNSECQRIVGRAYKMGKCVGQDEEKALVWYLKAAENDNKKAFEKIVEFSAHGEVECKKFLECQNIRMLAKSGNLNCIAFLADQIELNQFPWQFVEESIMLRISAAKKGHKESLEKIEPLAANGNAEAQFVLGEAYLNGRGKEKCLEKAIDWLNKAEENDHEKAKYGLGHLYWIGLGIEEDKLRAIELFVEAAEAGNEQAKVRLKFIEKTGFLEKALEDAEKKVKLGDKKLEKVLNRILVWKQMGNVTKKNEES